MRDTEIGLSVLMPVYNGAAFVETAVRSVLASALPLELVVVDDGSTDASGSVLDEIAASERRVVVLRHPANLGLVASLVDGLSVCRGPLVARLDADDINLPGRLEAQYAAMIQDPALVLTWTSYERVDELGVSHGVIRPPLSHAAMVFALSNGNAILHSSVMMRSEALVRVGGYSGAAFPAEDYDLWWRLLRIGAGTGLPIVGVRYLRNPGGISQLIPERQADAAAAVVAQARADLQLPMHLPASPGQRLIDVRRRSNAARRAAKGVGGSSTDLSTETVKAMLVAAEMYPRWLRWVTVCALAPLAVGGALRARRRARR